MTKEQATKELDNIFLKYKIKDEKNIIWIYMEICIKQYFERKSEEWKKI